MINTVHFNQSAPVAHQSDDKEMFFVGVSLGLRHEPSAIAVIERKDKEHHCRHLHRCEIGLPYVEVLGLVKDICDKINSDIFVVVDGTAVGKETLKMFRNELHVSQGDVATELSKPEDRPKKRYVVLAMITGGIGESYSNGSYMVPRRNVGSTLNTLMELSQLRIASQLALADELKAEMANFKIKTPASDDVIELRHGAGDDLVLAAGVACWWSMRVGNSKSVSLAC